MSEVDMSVSHQGWQFIGRHRVRDLAGLGGSTGVNVVASLLNRVVRLIHGNAMPMEMFKIELQAIAWLREKQRQLSAAKPVKK